MKRIIDLVDSIEYTTSNCFTHQLCRTLNRIPGVETVEVASINVHKRPDLIVSRLKQRTLQRIAPDLARWAQDTPVVVYDQDPWEAFRDGSPHKGSYQTIYDNLNVVTFAVTTKWWSDFIVRHGLPATFVSMWVLPEYCDSGPPFETRETPLGFIGSVHPYRKELFSQLLDRDIHVSIRPGGLGYRGYLDGLSKIGCFVHSEDRPLIIDGEVTNLNVGLWIKDVEAAARGCFSIRSRGSGSETYLGGIGTVMLYDSLSEVPDIIEGIMKIDPKERQRLIESTVDHIRKADRWEATARTLVSYLNQEET